MWRRLHRSFDRNEKTVQTQIYRARANVKEAVMVKRREGRSGMDKHTQMTDYELEL